MSYVFKSAFQLLFRFPIRSALFASIVVIFLMCVHALFFIQQTLKHTESLLEDRLTLSLYVDRQYSYESQQMQDFLGEFRRWGSNPEVEYISKEVALDREVRRNSDLLDILGGENPLPDAVVIDITPDNISRITSLVERYEYLFSLDESESYQQYQDQVSKIQEFQQNFQAVQIVVYIALFVFALSLAFTTFLFIQNHSYLFFQELKIALLSGASWLRMMSPYWLLVFVIGSTAFLVAIACTYWSGNVWPLSTFELPSGQGDRFNFESFLEDGNSFFWYEYLSLLVVSGVSVTVSLLPVFRKICR